MQTIILIIFLIFSLLIYYINNIFIISSLFLITLLSLIILKIKLKGFKHLLILTLLEMHALKRVYQLSHCILHLHPFQIINL